MNLSKHFTLEEFTKSQTGERLGIDNGDDADDALAVRDQGAGTRLPVQRVPCP